MKLYKIDGSPPARASMMIVDLVGAPVELVDVNLFAGEHLKQDYVKKNPAHTVPLLEDGDFVLQDSHAINIYLTEAFGKDDSLYPKDIKQRALVNQMLFFDTSILFPRLRSVTFATFFEGLKTPSDKQLKDISEAYDMLEAYLTKRQWLAGDHMTIADISAVASVSTLVYIQPLDTKKYPKINGWLTSLIKLPTYQKFNLPGVTFLGEKLREIFNS